MPILLNTSLNENEPIVRTPAEAISCFLRTDMDVIVLGNQVVDRHHIAFPENLRRRVSKEELIDTKSPGRGDHSAGACARPVGAT